MSKQDIPAVRTASDLERKYQFGKRFEEILGLVDDTRETVDEVESNLREQILEQSTSLTRNTSEIVAEALKSYVETSKLEELERTLRTEFTVKADGISGRVEAAEKSIKNVDGDLQEKFNTITKYFTFDVDGLTIGQADNHNKVVIDNDDITILVNNNAVLEFKADGSGLIPTLNITKQLNLLGLNITEDDTHINCDYVGV